MSRGRDPPPSDWNSMGQQQDSFTSSTTLLQQRYNPIGGNPFESTLSSTGGTGNGGIRPTTEDQLDEMLQRRRREQMENHYPYPPDPQNEDRMHQGTYPNNHVSSFYGRDSMGGGRFSRRSDSVKDPPPSG